MPERWQHELRKLKALEPPAGLWDRAMAGPRGEPPRVRRTWRVIAPIAAALAVVVVAGTLALVRAFGPSPVRPSSPAHRQAVRFVDPHLGWTIRVPKGLRVRHFHSTGRVTIDGVRVTSFPPDLRAPSNGTPPMGWLRSFPADGVAVQIWTGEGGPVAPPPLRDSTFPLSPASFRRIRPYVGGTEPRPWCTFWHGTYYVLGRASRYPTGSVTMFPASSLPGSRAVSAHVREGFYLIHAPRAFYVIHRLFEQPLKPFTTCTLAFDRKAFEFYCPGTGLRWNRVGQPMSARTYRGSDWNLPLVPATVAQDGQILFSPFWGDVPRVDLGGNPWS